MVSIAKISGRQAVALLSDMNQPLGNAVGNALEVKEAIETLHGRGPEDFWGHCREIAAHLIVLGEAAGSLEEARNMADEKRADGSGWERFRALVAAQGGDVAYVDAPDKLPAAEFVQEMIADQSGYLKSVNAQVVGETSVDLGAGRAKKGDAIDHAVGIMVHAKVGDKLEKGQPIFTVHANDKAKLDAAKARLLGAIEWSEEPVDPLPLFYGVVQ